MNQTLKAVLVDDERLARKRLRELLAAHPEVELIGEADSVEAAATLVDTLRPDIVFLDVEMPRGNGFELIRMLPPPPHTPHVVFVTAFEAFAVDAFAADALDYLLKPIHPQRLAITIRRLHQTQRSIGAPSPPTDGAADRWTLQSQVSLPDGRKVFVVEIGEISAIQALGAYSKIRTSRHPPVLVLRNLAEWERRLPQESFLRVDRSWIIQPGLVRATETISRDETQVTLDGIPEKLSLGRIAASRLKRHLHND